MTNKILLTILCITVTITMLFTFTSCNEEESHVTTPVGSVNESESPEDSAPDETEQKKPLPTIEETVMWDNDDVKITALSLTTNQYNYVVKMRVENKTDKELQVTASRTAVNSFVVEPSMLVKVSPNSVAEGDFRVHLDDVAAGVVADIETRFTYTSTDYTMNRKTERVKLLTSAAESFDYSYDESGTVLYDERGIKIICQGFNDEGNPMIYLSSTGELSEGCCVDVYQIYVNDKKTYSNYCAWVFTNTRNYAEMEIDSKDTDGNELGEMESLKVSFRINKENMVDRNPVITELVEIPLK